MSDTLSPQAESARADAVMAAEGWALFDVGGGLFEIERDDEADRFATDDDAVAWVRARAAEGSQPHIDALRRHDRDEPVLAARRWPSPVASSDAEPAGPTCTFSFLVPVVVVVENGEVRKVVVIDETEVRPENCAHVEGEPGSPEQVSAAVASALDGQGWPGWEFGW